MNSLRTVENEFRQFLEAEDNLGHEDRVRALMAIFTKHFELSKLSHQIQYSDLALLASVAKQRFTNQGLPLFVSRKQVPQDCLVTLSCLEATLNYLNGSSLLNKEVSVNYTDPKL